MLPYLPSSQYQLVPLPLNCRPGIYPVFQPLESNSYNRALSDSDRKSDDEDDSSDSERKKKSKLRSSERERPAGMGRLADDHRVKRLKHNQDESYRRQRLREAFNELATLCDLESSDWKQQTILRSAVTKLSDLIARVKTLETTTAAITSTIRTVGPGDFKFVKREESASPEGGMEKFETDMLKEATVAMLAVGVSGRMIACNIQFAQLLGHSSGDELLKKHPSAFSLAHSNCLVSFFGVLSGLLASTKNTSQQISLQLNKFDDSPVDVKLTGWLAKDDQRQPKYMVFLVDS